MAEALCKDSTKRLDTSSISSVPEVTLQAYTRFHCCLGKALTEYGAEDWSVEEAEEHSAYLQDFWSRRQRYMRGDVDCDDQDRNDAFAYWYAAHEENCAAQYD